MEFEFNRDSDHRYLSVKRSGGDAGFQEKMVLRNSIPGLARVSVKYLNGEARYSYDARSCQTLEDMFTGAGITEHDMKKTLRALASVMKELDRYLLRREDLILDPAGILWNLERNEPVFCYYPDLSEYENPGFILLAEFLIEHVDHKDEEAAELAYRWFDRVSDGVWDPESIIGNAEIVKEEKAEQRKVPEMKIVEEHFSEEKENFYIRDDESKAEKLTKEKEQDKKTAVLGIIICIALTATAAGSYAILLTYPGLADRLGLSGNDHIFAGVVIAIIFAAAILGAVHLISKRKPVEEVPPFLLDKQNPAFRPDDDFLKDFASE